MPSASWLVALPSRPKSCQSGRRVADAVLKGAVRIARSEDIPPNRGLQEIRAALAELGQRRYLVTPSLLETVLALQQQLKQASQDQRPDLAPLVSDNIVLGDPAAAYWY